MKSPGEVHGAPRPPGSGPSGARQRLLSASAATLDRLLQPSRTPASRRLRRRRNQSPGRNIPVRTFADWNAPPPGFLEIDLVVHHGGSLSGSLIHSLVATDICTGWTEAVPLLTREQSLVVAGLEVIGRQLPFPVKGIDSKASTSKASTRTTRAYSSTKLSSTKLSPSTAPSGASSSPGPGPTARTTRPGLSRGTARWPDRPWPTGTGRCDGT